MKYLSRDISWLSFNQRVLNEHNKDIPLSEKLGFIGISSSNLDEFIRTRYPSSIKSNIDDLSFHIEHMHDEVQNVFIKNYKEHILNLGILTKWEREKFKDYIYPVITPVQIETTFAPKQGSVYVYLETTKNEKIFIQIPDNIPRFIRTPSGSIRMIDTLIIENLNVILRNMKCSRYCTFRIMRNAEVLLQGNDIDQYGLIEQMIKEREKSWITCVEIGNISDRNIMENLLSCISTAPETLILESDIVKLSDLKNINDFLDEPDRRRSFTPKKPKGFNPNESIFNIIDKKDRLVYHPFESFKESFVRFIQESADDPDVVSIKMTLYRVGEKSDIINALLRAVDNGKQVTVLVELKARFDEKNNIKLSNILIEAGVNIIYGSLNLKTHAKVCIVTRRVNDSIKIYSHVGTGNYNDANAKVYTDYSYFTSSADIGNDLTSFFNLLTTKQEPFESKEILYAPHNMRKTISNMIEEEAKKGKNGRIIIKCNSLTDDKICDKLYVAAKAGTEIILIVRGACIIPIENFGDNIKIYSIVGRFLEHSRVYVFGKRKDKKILIGSSDIMHRNLNNRNELLLRIKNQSLKEKIYSDIKMYLKDTANKYINTSGYEYGKPKTLNIFDSHKYFIDK